jgi:hypothetical protein
VAKQTKYRNAATGKFVAKRTSKSKRGGEEWTISAKSGALHRTVVTSESSAATLDRITAKHGKALKRLADK